MSHYLLTPAASEDFAAIYRYSFQQWGERQADNYYYQLVVCFEQLSANPLLGKSRTDFPSELWSILQGSHVVFYRPTSDGIHILRILHQSRDFPRHLT